MDVRIGSVTLANPVMTASGTAGYGVELAGLLDLASLGAVVVKSLAHFEWAGNPALGAGTARARPPRCGSPRARAGRCRTGRGW